MNTILTGKSIIKTYGMGEEKQKVLNEVSIDIREGEFVSVMGPSGSGKSTLLYALSGMDKTDAGKVLFAGKDLSEMRENELADLRRERMGFVFQQPTMLKNLNILDNIILPAMRASRSLQTPWPSQTSQTPRISQTPRSPRITGKIRNEIVEKALQLMWKTGIQGLGDRSITQVSGGQLQRAGVCRALMCSPQIIFGDEPTGALNSKSAQEIMDILCSINKEGTAILLVTHDAKVAAGTERILFMSDGRINDEIVLGKFTGADMDYRIKRVMDQMKEMGI